MRTITSEEARALDVKNLEATIVARDANRPEADTPGYGVHEFGTAALRNELHWMRGCALPFIIHEGEGLAEGLLEIETFGSHHRTDDAAAHADIRDPGSA